MSIFQRSHLVIPILNFFIQILNLNNFNRINQNQILIHTSDNESINIKNDSNTNISNMIFALRAKDKNSIKNHENQSNIVRILSSEEMNCMPKQKKQNYIGNLEIRKENDNSSNNIIANYLTEKVVIYRKDSGILSNNLRKDELLNLKERNQRKLVRERFKRALQVEQIHFKFPQRTPGKKGEAAILFTWRRIPVWSSPGDIIHKVSNFWKRRSPEFPTANQKLLMQKLDAFPVFTVENNLRQLILTYPPEVFLKNWRDKFYDWYYRIFEWEKDTRATDLGFFFFNPEDAYLYQYNIQKFGALSAKDLGTRVTTSRLSTAYKLNRTSPPETRFMLLPDIKEVGDLMTIYRYRYGKKMKFHPKQRITKDGFANQPIYIIEKPQIKTGWFSKKTIKYEVNGVDHNYIFLSLEAAEAAWNLFRKLNTDLQLPMKPNLLVYNFHSFIKDYEQDPDSSYKDFTLVPNRETYELINILKRQDVEKGQIMHFYETRIIPKLFFIKLWFNRFKLILFHAPRINEFPRRELLLSKEGN